MPREGLWNNFELFSVQLFCLARALLRRAKVPHTGRHAECCLVLTTIRSSTPFELHTPAVASKTDARTRTHTRALTQTDSRTPECSRTLYPSPWRTGTVSVAGCQ